MFVRHPEGRTPVRTTARALAIAVACVLPTFVLAAPQGAPFASPEQRAVSLRMIVTESAEEAEAVRQQVQADGGDFGETARRLSHDPSAARGGLLGRLSLETLRPELRAALAGLAVGQVSAVVRIPTGFAILKVVPDDEVEGAGASLSRAVDARGSVRFATDVSGFGEASIILRQHDKPAGWDLDPLAICRMRNESMTTMRRVLEADIATASEAGVSALDLVQAHTVLGQMHAYDGRMAQTIAEFDLAYALARRSKPDAVPQLDEALGIAHLHKAEIDSGLYSEPGDRCLLPAPMTGLRQSANADRAVEHFTRFLEARPDDLEGRWLLNLAQAAAGKDPRALPDALRIDPAIVGSEGSVGRFVDVATAAGVRSVGSAGGVIVDDFDGDGQFDIVTSSFTSCEPMHFFARTGDGSFVEGASGRGLAGQLGGLNLLQADYDNDGRLDILVMRGGWEIAQRRSLLHNEGNGTFTDVTEKSGLARPATSSQASVWADIDNDGYVDLFVGNEDQPAQLFRNRRDGTFEDVAAKAGVARSAFSKGVAAGDYDNDGWVDLYVSNIGGRNFLYRNNHDGTFTERGGAAGVPGSEQGFATWFFDYDNDGWQDLFVTSYFTSVDETVRTYLQLPHNAGTLKLYRNLGDGSFQDVTRQVGLDKVFMPMGANFGDIDNDGFLDIYLGTGNPSYASLIPSVLLRNDGGRGFIDVTASSGTGEMHKGHGVAFADLDGDGHQEIVFEVGGATPGDAHPLRLFRNPGDSDNGWLGLKLVGSRSNRGAIGARITLTVTDTTGSRRVLHRVVNSGGSFGASPLRQHVGLGASVRKVDVDVWWPSSDTRQHFADVGHDRVIELDESRSTVRSLAIRALPLGGAAPLHAGDRRSSGE